MEKKDVLKIYNLQEKVIFCRKCTISNQRPRTYFDENSICSACNYAEKKRKKIDWNFREQELKKLCDRFRSKKGNFDVVVPCSGGKDSSYVAHQLKHKYNMNPLCVTSSPLEYTEAGKKNLQNFIDSGFDHIKGTPNPVSARKLTQFFLKEIGDPFQPFIFGQMNFPISIAVKHKIPFLMYGENGEAEYGGDLSKAESPTRELKDFNKYYFSNYDLTRLEKNGIPYKDLSYYMPPSENEMKKNNTEIHFFGYYKFWDPQENFYYCMENTGFATNLERTEGTFSKYSSLDDRFDGFHYYLAYIKFGIGRATSDTAQEIRSQKIDRDEGIALVKKYDGEFPIKYFKRFLDYCSIDKKNFESIIDSWRPDHLWEKDQKNKWRLRNPIWGGQNY